MHSCKSLRGGRQDGSDFPLLRVVDCKRHLHHSGLEVLVIGAFENARLEFQLRDEANFGVELVE